MNDQPLPNPISTTGATIALVTFKKKLDNRCEPCEECRPVCESEGGLDCHPDCTCDPDCQDQANEPVPEHDSFPPEEDQDCEPNT